MPPTERQGFTLIELLIVIAIILILISIAMPNFIEAHQRAKVVRTMSDMTSVRTAIESYGVDHREYPAPYGIFVNGRDSWAVLSTPVAYIKQSRIIDPFASGEGSLSQRTLTYELVNRSNQIIETSPSPPFSVSPAGQKGDWWWIASRGPDGKYGFKDPSTDPEAPILQKFFEADIFPENWLTVVFSPTNGTKSLGNLYRAGGLVRGFAGRTMLK